MSPALQRCQRGIEEARALLAREVARTYPVGSGLIWVRAGAAQYGTVVGHNSSAEIEVLNQYSRKRYFIQIEDVMRKWAAP